MSEHPIFYVANRNPSITETITSGGVAVDLTTSTVKFKARAVGSSTLLVDQTATIVTPAAGTVRYDWSAADIATNGILNVARKALVWWEVTTAGKTQDMGEAIIEVRAHAPETLAYVELEEFKSTAMMTGESFADNDIQSSLIAASRWVDQRTHRRFYPDADVNQVRYYTPNGWSTLEIDDLLTLTSLLSDSDGDGTFEQTWVENTDFTLEPLNAVADGRPWESIRLRPASSFRFSRYPRSLKLTGKFGWAAVPENIKRATTIVAARVLKRTREAPFGVISFPAEGGFVRELGLDRDPELAGLLGPYTRAQVLA
jgi:hypothetical protein